MMVPLLGHSLSFVQTGDHAIRSLTVFNPSNDDYDERLDTMPIWSHDFLSFVVDESAVYRMYANFTTTDSIGQLYIKGKRIVSYKMSAWITPNC